LSCYSYSSLTKQPFLSHSLPEKILPDLFIPRKLDHPLFTSFDFATVIFFAEQDRQPCVQLPTWWTRSLYLCLQWQGGPVMGFPFCRLLRLAGLRWRYSNPPPRGDDVVITVMYFIHESI
jgi:hypothetical protein